MSYDINLGNGVSSNFLNSYTILWALYFLSFFCVFFFSQRSDKTRFVFLITNPSINMSRAYEIIGSETGFADVNLVSRALRLHVNLMKWMFSQSIIMIGPLWLSICPRLFQVAALQKINCIWLVNIMDSNYKHTI